MNGAYPLGFAPFCGEPEITTLAYEPVAPPAAVTFDPASGDFLLDADGRYEEGESIEEQVTLSFAAPRGSLKHAPEIGHDFLTLPRVSGARLDAEIDRAAVRATPFDRLLAAGRVEFLGCTKVHPKNTETRLAIRWRKTGAIRSELAIVGR